MKISLIPTIGELKQAISNIPDETPIQFPDHIEETMVTPYLFYNEEKVIIDGHKFISCNLK